MGPLEHIHLAQQKNKAPGGYSVLPCFGWTGLLASPDHRSNLPGRGLAEPRDGPSKVDRFRSTVSFRELGQPSGRPVLVDPGVLVIGRFCAPKILLHADDDPVGVDVLHLGGGPPEPAAGGHDILIEEEPYGEVLLLPQGIEGGTEDPRDLALGIDCSGDTELPLIPPGPGAEVLEGAGLPLESVTLTGGDLAVSDDRAAPIDVIRHGPGTPHGAEISHDAVFPPEGVPLAVQSLAPADDHAEVINRGRHAVPAPERTETPLFPIRRPTDGAGVTRTVEAPANNHAVVVDVVRGTLGAADYGAEILEDSVLPAECMASAFADHYAGIVDSQCLSPKAKAVNCISGGCGRAQLRRAIRAYGRSVV